MTTTSGCHCILVSWLTIDFCVVTSSVHPIIALTVRFSQFIDAKSFGRRVSQSRFAAYSHESCRWIAFQSSQLPGTIRCEYAVWLSTVPVFERFG